MPLQNRGSLQNVIARRKNPHFFKRRDTLELKGRVVKCKSAICGALVVSGGALTLLLTINHAGLKTDGGFGQAGGKMLPPAGQRFYYHLK